jgi:hypothetical protein
VAAFCAYESKMKNMPSSKWAIRQIRVQGRLVASRPQIPNSYSRLQQFLHALL